ncbi:MAG: SUMF1/EgtB/PvdO family nonheme iron enzyme [Candidatus Rokubacteria bacterium]|nr:SUMF1/EgtB/PvdO family nonheme iron enzyme [Candidatus Rokubacteria bacterium]
MPRPVRRSVLAVLLLPALGALALLAAPRALADGIMQIPAGAFWMGRDDGPVDEAPRHRVFLGVFWLERHKVTNAEFTEFLNERGLVVPGGDHRFDDDDADARIHRVAGRWQADAGFEHHPAVEVSWFGARDFCAWRGRRLPTEAEWEKAARGDDGRRYPWGDTGPTPALAVFGRRYNDTDRGDRRPAGTGPYRVEDLLGNLREWTSTVLRPYPYNPGDGREGFTGPGRVVVRGASHDDPADDLSVTRRRSYDRRGAAAGHHFVGFRCATSEDLGGRL